jgi:twinkle protein
MSTSHLNGSQSEFVRHEPCTECGSSDGNSLYSDGHTFCFVCHTWKGGDGKIHNHQSTNARKNYMEARGVPRRLSRRGISERVCEEYGITTDGELLCFHYRDSTGRLIGIKTKSKDKQFRYEGESDGRFFGQHLFRHAGKRVVITEGEIDAATCREALPTWEMVSLPYGAASAKKSIQQNYEWLENWEEICLFFDNDDAGRQATQEAAAVLPPGKVTIADLKGYKDASEAAQDSNFEAIREAIWNAKPYRPDGIVDGKSLLSLVIEPQQDYIHEYPYSGLQEKLHGIRRGELVTITSGSGQGKSSVCRELATHLLCKGERVGYVALEESNRRTALGLMSAASGKQFHIGTHERSDLTQAYQNTLANWNLFLFDGFGSFDPDNILSKIRYLAAGLDCRVVFLDHLSILLSGLDGDERKMIDNTMTKLRSLCEETGISMFLVSHLRRPQGDKGHEDGAKVSLGQLRGSHSISQLSDAVIGLERDQQSGPEHADTTVRILKNRYSGETGIACVLNYDKEKCKFNETKTFDATTDF